MRMACVCVLTAALATTHVATSAEVPIEAPGPRGPLKGTLSMPEAVRPLTGGAKPPIVLMVPGSGPTDRDGNNVQGVRAAPYRLLAEALAMRGVGTVRIDKRGLFGSSAAVPDANQVSIDDYAADVHSWVSVIRSETSSSCVWLMGHSEGGLVALAAARRPEGLCGLILLATPGRPLGDVLRAQLRANPANQPLLAEAEGAISTLERGHHADVSTMHPGLQRLFSPAVQDFFISSFRLDPAALIARYRGPVRVIQGDADLQVGVEDAQRLGQANASARVVVLRGVNHVLKAVTPGDRTANLAAYADPGLPIAPAVVDAISEALPATGTQQAR